MYKDKELIMKGTRNFRNGMYEVNLLNIENIKIPPKQPQPSVTDGQSNNVYHITKTKEVIEYLHQCCFSPKLLTWCNTIDNGIFSSWTHLTSKLARKHLQEPNLQ